VRFFGISKEIGIDLGTSNTLIFLKGKGVLLSEPSVIAINTINKKVVAVGLKAKNMIGRTPGNIETIRPLRNGVIADFGLTKQMLRSFIEKVTGKGAFKSSKIVISYPLGVTEVEKRAISQITTDSKARNVMMIEQPIAAAIGAGLPVYEPTGSMIIDLGGGTTEVAVISLGGIVASTTSRIAGDELDRSIINFVKTKFKVLIGERTAENVKIQLSSICDDEEETEIQIRGRDLITGLPSVIAVTVSEIREVFKQPVLSIIEAIKDTLGKTSPELVADIMDKGIMLTGGGALLKGLDKLISDQIHIPIYVSEVPLECVVLGAGKSLDMIDKVS